MPFTGLILALILWAGTSPAEAAHTKATLSLESETAKPGDTVLAGIHLHMDPGWHTYWRNPGPGGLGIPTSIGWELPAGVTAGDIAWPAPKKLTDKDSTTYIYEDDVVLLVPLKVSSDAKTGPTTLKATVEWLECEVQCLPGKGTVQAVLTIGIPKQPSKEAALLQEWQTKLPKNGASLEPKASWEKEAGADLRPVVIEWNTTGAAAETDFFPDGSEDFEVQPAVEKLPGESGKARLRAQVKKIRGDWPAKISGLLVQKHESETDAYEITAPVANAAKPAPVIAGHFSAVKFLASLASAFLGGLILNIMPCVLPVIALKILGFVSEARSDPARVRKLGLIYTAGVLCSFLVLALIAIVIGQGWGAQFGSPYFLIAMATLVTLIALNLFGVFEVTLAAGATEAASNLAGKQGASGTFFNGLFATALATSCSAPFLAPALAFTSSVKNPLVTIVIMLTLGLGMAAPYLVLSWQPAWLKFLPKPGRWMERFKVAMGFPMLAAAVWLCSLLTLHYEERTWWFVMFLMFLALAAWIYGEFVQRGSKHRGLAGAIALLILATGFGFALESRLQWRNPITETSRTNSELSSSVAPKGVRWEKWSPEAVAAARAAGRPVVVDFTATWCLTCNTIIKPSFESDSVQAKLKEVNAVALVADYSRRPDYLTDELRRFQRDGVGVPLVLVYSAKSDAPPLVYDFVTPDRLVHALESAVK